MTCALTVSVSAPAYAEPEPAPASPKPFPGRSVTGVTSVPTRFKAPPNAAATSYQPTATRMPSAAEATLTLGGSRARSAALPVWLEGGRGSARVRVIGEAQAHQSGLRGLMMTVAPDAAAAGKVRVGVDYKTFAEAYGGDYGARLRLFRMPACAATTPEAAACRTRTPLESRNDPQTRTVSAEVTLAEPMVLAAAAGTGSDSGTFAATDLKPSGSWSAGSNSGSFSYNVPVIIPPAVSGVVPSVGLSYDSASVDGQTASTQSQASWAGDGWGTPRSYIEQTFTSCKDKPEGVESPKKTSDLCYAGPVLTMSLNGAVSTLVWDAAKNVWKAESDGGEKITRSVNFDNGSGANDKNYWQVTTRDGTVYQFGRNRLPGWTSQRLTTNSVDTVPVYSPRATGPCHQASGFDNSWCTMARRWSLDYVEDVSGSAMTYYYTQEKNKYGRNNGSSEDEYVRDSYLDRIEYGFTGGNVYAVAPNRIVFKVDNRCASSCGALSDSTKTQYPDVPFDLYCPSSTSSKDCKQNWGPSFFSTKRLSSVVTEQYTSVSRRHEPVDAYALTHTMPATGDGKQPTLWLSQVVRTGYNPVEKGTFIQLPPIKFASKSLPNRVDTLSGWPSFYRHRLESITTESGSVITASYELTKPCGSTKPAPATNGTSCYPVNWTPEGRDEPIDDWFNKYAVTLVIQTDPTGGAVTTATSYEYDDPGWRFDDNELVKPKERTYGQFRGYGKVVTRSGDGFSDRKTRSESTYYRGLSRNNNSTVVNVTDTAGGVHEDRDELAGATLETRSFKGDGGALETSNISVYWVSAPSATRDRNAYNLEDLTANRISVALTYDRQALPGGGWRTTQTDNSYEDDVSSSAFGLLKAAYKHTDPVDPAYDRCTVNAYAPVNTTRNLVGLTSQSETFAKACGGFVRGTKPTRPAAFNTLTAPASVNRPAEVIDATRTFFDDHAWSTDYPQARVPDRGIATMVRRATGFADGAYTWQTTTRSKTDTIGRTTENYDANGSQTLTTYATDENGLPVGMTVRNALQQRITTTTEPRRGNQVSTLGRNDELTQQEYDALGRSTAVWLNSRAKTQPADRTFAYVVSQTGASSTTTNVMNDSKSYVQTIQLYDAQLRPRQTQAQTPQGGRMVTDTFYDTHGWVKATFNGWWDSTTLPSTARIITVPNLPKVVPNQTFTTYDGLGRPVIVQQAEDGVAVSETVTVHGGDRTTVIPPAGGTVTSTVTDPVGRTTSLVQYSTRPMVTRPADTFTGNFTVSGGTTTTTRYGYDVRGNQNELTDALGNDWTARYDLLGRMVGRTDPDGGDTSMTYDENGNVLATTDARQKTISATYDALNRKTAAYASPSDAQTDANRIARWVFDNADNAVPNMPFAKGKLTSSAAYWDGREYKTQVKGYNVAGKPTGESITIPDSEGALGGTYDFTHQYTPNNFLPLKEFYPAKGGLPAETTLGAYDAFDQIQRLGGNSGYTDRTIYDAYGRINYAQYGNSTNFAAVENDYDAHTGRLVERTVARQPNKAEIEKQQYRHDKVGNILAQTTTRTLSGNVAETQCYTYDELRRLTEAWTATDNCATQPTAANRSMVGNTIGGGSAYWTSWTFDEVGNRQAQIERNLTGGTDNTTDYRYDGNGKSQPHTLTSTTSTAPNPATSYAYDASGNMTSRNAGQGAQTLTWNDAGQLTKVSGPSGTSTNIYDADGNLLLQKDPGTTTLYLGAQQHVLNTSTNVVTGTRYYALPGGAVAVRKGTANTDFSFELSDGQGTPNLYLDNTGQTPTWRQFTPYGGPRGTAGVYPDNRAFLNKPASSTTGFTRLGAREYDPVNGHFISLDPLQDKASPQQWQGYTYANNNPVTFSDPAGTDPGGGQCADEGRCSKAALTQNAKKSDSGPAEKKSIEQVVKEGARCSDAEDNCTGLDPVGNWKKGQRFHELSQTQQAEALRRWYCTNNEEECAKMRKEESKAATEFFYELSGIADVRDCANGSVAGCIWTAIGVIPVVGKAAVAVKGGKTALTALRAGRAGRAGSGADTLEDLGSCLRSFSGDTKVVMADGSTKPIKDIKVSDEVRATDPETGKAGPRKVTHLWVHQDQLVDLQLSNGSRVTTTEDHPFWNATDQEWQEAQDLDPGDRLYTGGFALASNAGLDWTTTRTSTAYNLTIDDLHTYYVFAGNTPVLVHNTACPTFGFAKAPNYHGIYIIVMRDGRAYVGSAGKEATATVHKRLHKSFTDENAAVYKAGYTYDDVDFVSTKDMSGKTWAEIREAEQEAIDQFGGVNGGVLLNRRNEM
ncbi:polymorphic toxin-type HINT domain-containing protein [Actinoplanes sp. NBRC 103695]|uniref:polymorphic toxin-type HINT domain-containing protein n=1 Tax=Actinoplanes sp. NBRC 103695 TaxID=3032202 RepID=UPI002552DC7C|nr:polymorphic toxin-type HINT domain-containing protein [Actinoplanes sp. NBRC 103695]